MMSLWSLDKWLSSEDVVFNDTMTTLTSLRQSCVGWESPLSCSCHSVFDTGVVTRWLRSSTGLTGDHRDVTHGGVCDQLVLLPKTLYVYNDRIPSSPTPSTAPIFGVRLHFFWKNLPRRNTLITVFHTLSKEGTRVLTDLASFCYRNCVLANLPSFCYRNCFFVSGLRTNERGGIPWGHVHIQDIKKTRN
jgi:hypothetical protein